MKRGKKYLAALEKIEFGKKYTLDEAISTLKEVAFAKFDETVELTMWLGVDPRKADQLVRGTIVLPHGLGGAAKKVVVIAQGDKIIIADLEGALGLAEGPDVDLRPPSARAGEGPRGISKARSCEG
ncbi:MAG: 50S ribosomal protein L1, partial [Pyrinomonadaceae bacterium]